MLVFRVVKAEINMLNRGKPVCEIMNIKKAVYDRVDGNPVKRIKGYGGKYAISKQGVIVLAEDCENISRWEYIKNKFKN